MSKQIYLTKGQVAIVDDEDYDFLNKYLWFATKKGNIHYACMNRRRSDGTREKVLMHRMILNVIDREITIDHRDHDGLNNQKSNIRFCTHAENIRNRRAAKGKSSKYLGVDWQVKRKMWRVRISVDGVRTHLGDFETELAAALAYNKAAIKLHKEFASINTIDGCLPSTSNSGTAQTKKDFVPLE